jgi:Tol biopolymer transport system component
MNAARRLILVLAFLCALAGGLVFLAGSALAAAQYVQVSSFGSGGVLPAEPYGVAVEQASGEVFVADQGSVQRFAPVNRSDPSAGYSLGSPLSGSFTSAHGVGVDDSGGLSQGDVYVVESGTVVDKFDATGLPDVSTPQFGAGASPLALTEASGVAVDPADGDVYVTDRGSSVVDIFTPAGVFVSQFATGSGPRGLAFNSTGSDLYVTAAFNVEEYDSLGNPVDQTAGPDAGTNVLIGSESAFAVAVDASTNDVYVFERGGNVAVYESSGAPLAQLGFNTGIFFSLGMAVDSATHTVLVSDLEHNVVDVFALVTPPAVSTGPATGVTVSGAKLEGTVNPEGVPVTSCEFEYGTSGSYGQSVPCQQTLAEIGSGIVAKPVSAEVTGLQQNTVYHYRLVAGNAGASSQGQDQTLITSTAPSIDSASVKDLGASSGDLTAQINPNGADTTYRFEYGTSTAYGTSVPVPDGDLAAVHGDETVTVHLTGLQANIVYHFRVVAQNGVGVTTGVDHTFVYTSASGLPDGRVYEQVSPTDKDYTDALGGPGEVQASPSGDGVTFFSISPFPGVPGAPSFPTYLSTRGGDGWSTQGLLPVTAPGAVAPVVGLTEDLSETIVEATEPPLAPGATPEAVNYYVGDNATGVYRLLAHGPGQLSFVAATADDSRILFEDTAEELVPGVRDEHAVPYLYEWDNGQITLVGVLPGGSPPAGGAAAGPGGPLIEHELGSGDLGGAASHFYTQDTISEDGSRVFFSDAGTGRIYVREPQAERTVPVSEGEAYWRAATPDGRFVFYTEGEGEESNLYRFDVESETREALTSGKTDVRGTLGVSADGAYVYFAAGGGERETGADLYEWHDGATTLVSGGLMQTDWLGGAYPTLGESGERVSRVTPDGMTVLFNTRSQLTSYDNAGHTELYLFDAAGGTLTCVSCNPSGIAATSNAETTNALTEDAPPSRNAFLARILSADGRRVFFNTKEALVPQDTNGQLDVYEWEGGHVYLISTGKSPSVSYFGDASVDGSDVFFFTRQALVGQDQDNNTDIYDARVGGGLAAQNPAAPVAPCAGEACLAAPSAPPVFGVSSSAALSGTGNLTPPTSPPAVKSKAKALTGAQKLAKALKACRREPKKKRAVCEAQARKRYPGRSKARRAGRSAGTSKSSGRPQS